MALCCIWQTWRVRNLIFTSYVLAQRTMRRSVFSLQAGGQSTQVSLYITGQNSATLLKEEEVDLKPPWTDSDPYPLVRTCIHFFSGAIQTHTSNLY